MKNRYANNPAKPVIIAGGIFCQTQSGMSAGNVVLQSDAEA
jgi:hypothetical protein